MPQHILSDLVAYLDDFLSVADVPDASRALNGLQVDNSGRVSHVAAAVDACQATIDRAGAIGADLLLVHHGLFWRGLEPLTGRHGRRVRALLEHDVALYASHVPLDCHPDVGNNAVLARDLGLTETEPFGDYDGMAIGIAGAWDGSLEDLARALADRLGADSHVIAKGPRRLRRVGIVTGGASSLLRQARDAGIDTFITGEGPHHTFFDAEEWGLNLIYAGHYATETVGVQALAAHLQDRFDLPWDFIDHPTGL